MFQITTAQLATFQGAALSTFEGSMVARVAALSPAVAASLGDAQVLVVVRAAIARAARHGFTFKGPVGLFVDLSLLLGAGFDADVQYPWVQSCLETAASCGQMQGALALYTESTEALRRIQGAERHPLDAGLRRISALIAALPAVDAGSSAASVLEAMWRVHPEKCAFVGEPALRALIAAGEAEAARYGLFDRRDVLLLVAILFALGQRCAGDPLYPWIAGTLGDPTIPTPALRARQLEETALAWQSQVLTTTESSS